MHYPMVLHLVVASLLTAKVPQHSDSPAVSCDPALTDVLHPALQRLLAHVESFRRQPLSPANAHLFEQRLQQELRELGRQVTQWTYNHLESPSISDLPRQVSFACGLYTRLNHQTPQNVWTLFGQIRLWRVGYRPSDKSSEPTIFPLAMALGLVHGASAALAERAAHLLGDSGMSQNHTWKRLRQDHAVGWGVKKLREVTTAVATALAEQRQEVQVEKLLELLQQASGSKGRHLPVLSVGRDGITLGIRQKGGEVYKVATTATVTLLDRRGKRLGTVYLAYAPEANQETLGQELTRLLQEVFRRWEKPLPRLCYVSDAGDNETKYYNKVLSRRVHPRTKEKLLWIRVVDYYHASERIWKMAEMLFGKGQRGASWARKMQKWLKKPGGVNRVLHSAAAYRDLHEVKGKNREEFEKAYRYLRKRMKYMKYAEYKRVGVPLGSGVTEAGCKTIYTQRLKLSGMSWKKPGAQTVLNLRVLQLSGVWEEAYQRVLHARKQPKVWGQNTSNENSPVSAA